MTTAEARTSSSGERRHKTRSHKLGLEIQRLSFDNQADGLVLRTSIFLLGREGSKQRIGERHVVKIGNLSLSLRRSVGLVASRL
jgi:hypothetical protein